MELLNYVVGLKIDRMISVCFQGKPFTIMVIQVYAPNSNAEEAEVERFYEDLPAPCLPSSPAQRVAIGTYVSMVLPSAVHLSPSVSLTSHPVTCR